MSDKGSKPPEKPPRRFWKKKRWWVLVILLSGLVWLDGPGWKWIAHAAADRYFLDLGYTVEFELEGRLSSGDVRISNLQLGGDALIRVADLDQLQVTYALSRIVKGEVESLEVEGIHVEVDLAAAPPAPDDDPEQQPVDPAALLTDLRARLVPMKLGLRDVSAVIHRDDDLLFSIEPSSILHEPGSERFQIQLGAMELPGGNATPAQTTVIDWRDDQLTLDHLYGLEEVSIDSLEAEIGDPFQFRANLRVADARFRLETDLDQASLLLTEGPLSADDFARVAKLELPVEATLKSLDIKASELSGGLETLVGDIALEVGDIDFDGWTSGALALTATLPPDAKARATLKGTTLGSPVTLGVNAELDRSRALLPTRASASLEAPEFQAAMTHLRDRFRPNQEAPAPSESALKLTAEATFNNGTPDKAKASLDLTGGADTPPLDLDARWEDEAVVLDSFTTRGLTIEGGFAPEALSYRGDVQLDGFVPSSLDPWLKPWGIQVPEGITANLTWQGSGNVRTSRHEGRLEITETIWLRRGETEPLIAVANGDYRWPESLDLESLKIRQADQTITSRAMLADRVLSLGELTWNDGDDVLADGTASIPVPDDLSDWKALLRETRPITIDFETPELPLSKLHPFLPENIRFPESSRAKVEVDLTGTPAAPELIASVRASHLGLTSQPRIPPAALELDAIGKGHDLKVEGGLITADYPPAKISLVTNWDPALWAEDPETVTKAQLDAGLTISDLNLASLATFVPKARKLAGNLNAVVQVGGTVGTPEPNAEVTLGRGALRMEDPELPRVSKGTMRISATPEQVTIDTISAEVSAGTVAISGTVDLEEWKPSMLDLKLNANSLPAIRDESIILRFDAGLALTGTWEDALLSGKVEIVDSLFFKDVELLPIGEPLTNVNEPTLPSIDAPPPKELTERIPKPFVDWRLALDVRTRSPFLIRGNLATGAIQMAAQVEGTVGGPRPRGEANLHEIVAQLPFSKLEVKTGKVKLRPDHPFDPILELRGTSRIRPYDIAIYVLGPISSPSIQPTSSPPLPESEIMTLIATGTTTTGLENAGSATARATQLLLEEARRGRIGAVRMLRPVFSVLDKLDFQVGEEDPYSSKEYNSVSLDINDNWVLTAGISEEGNTRTKITYLFRFR